MIIHSFEDLQFYASSKRYTYGDILWYFKELLDSIVEEPKLYRDGPFYSWGDNGRVYHLEEIKRTKAEMEVKLAKWLPWYVGKNKRKRDAAIELGLGSWL